MKLYLVINTLECGGAERYVQNIARCMTKRGHDVTVVVFDNSAQHYPIDGAQVLDLGERGWRSLWGRIVKLRRLVKRGKPDVVLAVQNTVNMTAIVATLGLPVTVVTKEDMLPFDTLWLARRLYWIIYRFADGVICVSRKIKGQLIALGVSRHLCMVIHNPVDCELVREQSFEYEPLNGWECMPWLVSVNNLSWYKDYDTLLRAFAAVVDKLVCGLVVIGSGPQQERLERLRSELGLRAYVRFIGTRDNPFPYMRRAAIAVSSSISEGFPHCMTEAMACGTPVVCTSVGWTDDIITDGVDGVIVPPRDPNAMAKAILDLMRDYQRRKAIGLAGQNRARDFDIDAICEKHERYFGILGVK